jgi:hypothetical protein
MTDSTTLRLDVDLSRFKGRPHEPFEQPLNLLKSIPDKINRSAFQLDSLLKKEIRIERRKTKIV